MRSRVFEDIRLGAETFDESLLRQLRDALGLATQKTAMTTTPILKNANDVAEGKSLPAFSKFDYEDKILDIAREEARPGETEEGSLQRLMCLEKDSRCLSLYEAAQQAQMIMERSPLSRMGAETWRTEGRECL